MRGMTFANFRTDDNNQSAFDVCRRLAALEDGVVSPVTLLGDKGVGKSHLLWAIVNHFRENQTRVSIALISASDFPRKARALAKDSTPIQRSRPAVLLVDELELFKEDAEELEGVVRAFLDNGKIVVLASRVHPSMLSACSGAFKALLTRGQVVGLGAPESDAESIAGVPAFALEQISALRNTVAELERERQRLLDRLEVGGSDAGAAPDSQSLRQELETVRLALEGSEGELQSMRMDFEAVRDRDEAAAAALAELRARLAARQAETQRRMEGLQEALGSLAAEMDAVESGSGGPDEAFERLAAEKWKAESALEEAQGRAAVLQEEVAVLQARERAAAGGTVKPLPVSDDLKSAIGRAFADPEEEDEELTWAEPERDDEEPPQA